MGYQPRTYTKHVDLYRSLLIGATSVQKRRIGPSVLPSAGGSLWAEFPSVFNSILFHEGGLQVLITPSPLSHLVSPWGSVASDRPPRSGGNAAAHIAGQEFAIRVCRARLRLRSRFSSQLSILPSGRLYVRPRDISDGYYTGCQPRFVN